MWCKNIQRSVIYRLLQQCKEWINISTDDYKATYSTQQSAHLRHDALKSAVNSQYVWLSNVGLPIIFFKLLIAILSRSCKTQRLEYVPRH